MTQKTRVGLLFGGKSAEHEVSLQSAKNVHQALDKAKYDVVLIGIDKTGQWFLCNEEHFYRYANDPNLVAIKPTNQRVALLPGTERRRQFMDLENHHYLEPLDVVFPVLHGTFGEDGTIQGLLRLADIPFVGASVLGSAVGMDKDVMKRLLRDAGIPIADFQVFHRSSISHIHFDMIVQRLGLPFFVKPANMGSSVGIHKVQDEAQLSAAIQDAFLYDDKIIVEENVIGREIECSVLGNNIPVASLPGEVLPHHEFYSYDAKYLDEDGAGLVVPADLPADVTQHIQEMAVKTFLVLCCEGMARVDFFLKKNNKLLVNEINTIPGFTKISMYPKLWEVSGISYSNLIDRLIQLALERNQRQKYIHTSFDHSSRPDNITNDN